MGRKEETEKEESNGWFLLFLSEKEWQSSEIRYLVVDLDDQKLVKKWSRRKLQKVRVGTKVTAGQTTIDQKTVKKRICDSNEKKIC